jgi:thiol-disulfide isomerase/thioredoxin
MMNGEFSEDYPKILFFSSQHCMPCKPVEDKLKRINISMFGKKLRIDKINIDIKENITLMKEYNITSVPTLIIGEQKLRVNIEEEDIIDAILQAFISSVKIE